MNTSANPESLLNAARHGEAERFGELLERYRHYLRLLARIQIGQRLQSKIDASDIVQETFLEAHRHFVNFRGATEAELIAWLKQILAGNLANLLRRYIGTQARDVLLEREIADAIDRSSMALDAAFVARCSSPSHEVSQREQAVLLANALEALPEDYREVIILRHFEGLTFPKVAERMGRSVDSVEKLWLRAVTRLRQSFGENT
jgi:RNA polymerase sigma-70 factor (ECF subfamily)